MALPFCVMTEAEREKLQRHCRGKWIKLWTPCPRLSGGGSAYLLALGEENQTTPVKHGAAAGHVAGAPACDLPFLSLRCGSTGRRCRQRAVCLRLGRWVQGTRLTGNTTLTCSVCWLTCLEFLGLLGLVSRCGRNLSSVFVIPSSLSPKSTFSFENQGCWLCLGGREQTAAGGSRNPFCSGGRSVGQSDLGPRALLGQSPPPRAWSL